jgi:hypothetical protein
MANRWCSACGNDAGERAEYQGPGGWGFCPRCSSLTRDRYLLLAHLRQISIQLARLCELTDGGQYVMRDAIAKMGE